MKADIKDKVKVPKGVSVSYANDTLTVKGPKGEVSRTFFNNRIDITVESDAIVMTSKEATRREQRMMFTFKSHLNNMVKGVQTPWVYELKVCSSHFPMNVKIDGGMLKVKNFLGEKKERLCAIPQDVKVNVQGANITVESPSIERAGNVASALELTTRITNRDLRIFQDGIFITKKAKQE